MRTQFGTVNRLCSTLRQSLSFLGVRGQPALPAMIIAIMTDGQDHHDTSMSHDAHNNNQSL
jgi:hypothetical protein